MVGYQRGRWGTVRHYEVVHNKDGTGDVNALLTESNAFNQLGFGANIVEVQRVSIFGVRGNVLCPLSIAGFAETGAKHRMSLHKSMNGLCKGGYIDGTMNRKELALVEAVPTVFVGAVVEEELLDR